MQPQIHPSAREFILTVERVLGEALGERVLLNPGEILQDGIRSLTYRFRLLEGPDHGPTSVIVKQVKSTDQARYAPKCATIPAWTFFNEWASLQFLGKGANGNVFGPRFYGGDDVRGMMVMEDLGPGKRLDHYLMGNDSSAAESALIEFAAIHGRLHAATIGRQDEFKHLRESLGPSILEDGHHTYEWLAPTFYQAADLLGIPPEPGVAEELNTLKEALLHPGPFFSFIQNDACPDNCLFHGTTLRLLDFEGGTFDHALKEGVYGRMYFPTCRYVYQMPAYIPLRMETAYRAELVKGCPEAKDEKLFSFAVAEACVYWMIRWYQMDPLVNSLENDLFLVAATSRQRHLLRSQIVAQTAREAGHMEAVGATIGKMAAKMHTLWPRAADIPAYPAFR